nr:retrovirus-related Pol polyprotein from transposon TNT 1-94 [Tanacetum cinerariifolium]
MTDYSLWEVIINGDSPIPIVVVEGTTQPATILTADQKLARRNELKARGTLLMALPNKHHLKFNSHKDAKTLMEKLVSQLEIHGVSLSQEDVNLKFLCSLPSEWKTHTLIWRNKANLEEHSLDDLFNSLRIYEAEVKQSFSPSNPTQNIAFVSSSNTDITTDLVRTVTSVSAVCAQLPVSSHPTIDSLRRNLGDNRATTMGFDMSKVECYNCHRKRHFARECRSPKDNRRTVATKPQRRHVPVETSTSNALVFQCDGIRSYDWSYQAEEELANFALMAIPSSSSVSNNEVKSCTKECSKSYDELHSQYDKLTIDFRKSQLDVLSYQAALEYVEARLVLSQPSGEYHAVPPSITGNFMPPKPDLVFHTAPMAVETTYSAFTVQPSPAKLAQDISHATRLMAPIIEDWVSDSEDESEPNDPQKRNGGYVAFGGNSKGGKITGKGKIKTDSLLPIPFWAEAVNTTYYVHNRVLVSKPQNKTSYELLHSRPPSIGFMRPFGCPVTILNTLDSLGKLERKVDEGFLVGYSVNSKAFRVFNSRNRIVQETLHVNFLENKPNVAGTGPTWLFDINSLTRTMNYQPVTAGNHSNPSAGFQEEFDAGKTGEEAIQQFNLSPSSSALSGEQDDITKKRDKGKSPVDYFTGNRDFNEDFEDYSEDSSNDVSAAGPIVPTTRQNYSNSTNPISAAGPLHSNTSPIHGNSSFQDASQSHDMLENEDIVYSDHENASVEADFNNLETSITVKQKEDVIFINQDKYVAEILKKFGLTKGKSASTPIVTEKPLLKDPDGEDVDVHIYRSIIGSLMYLTSSRPDIMFAFWRTVAVKSSNEITWLQALVDKKRVVVTKAAIRDALHLDDAERVVENSISPSISLKVYQRAEDAVKETEEVREYTADTQVEGRQANIYHNDMDHAAKVLSMQEDESEVQEAVEVVTTAKFITEVIAAVSEIVSAAAVIPSVVHETISAAAILTITAPSIKVAAPVKAAVPSTRRKRGVVIRDP